MHDYSISLYQYRLVGFFVLLLQNGSVIHIVLQHAFFFSFFFHFPMIMIIFPSQQEFLRSVRYFHVCICQNLLTNSYIGTIEMTFAFHSAVVFCSLPKKVILFLSIFNNNFNYGMKGYIFILFKTYPYTDKFPPPRRTC